jgi:DNA-binding IclR family transcriptional regulator
MITMPALPSRPQPVLGRLVDQVGQNAHFSVLHGSDVYYVIEERASGRAPLVSDVGVRLPATLTASGLAVLSRLPAAQLRAIYPSAAALVQRDGRVPGTLLALRSMLIEVRRRGFALEENLVTPGLSSVGLPVLDHTGHQLAGISVTFEADRVDDGEQRQLVDAARRAAEALTRRLGG